MNRAERRKKQKQNNQKLTYEQAHKAAVQTGKEAMNKGVIYATDRQLLIMCLALRDSHGWGHKRIMSVLNKMEDIADGIERDYLKIEDIRSVVKDELKINLIKC